MSTVNVNVQANGLNSVLASMVQMQQLQRDLVRTLRTAAGTTGLPISGTGGGSGGVPGSGGTPNLNGRGGSGSNNLQAIRDSARRESGAIVAAYAEIASTVFATTAAFNALKEAAQFGTLLTAQRNFAKETGTNMQSVAKSLQDVARHAVSFQEATQFASIGRLAGFTTKQIQELTQTGISAATILGRDIPDALSRMFRGVAKGEPEILDELGIFIRLDKAYKAYVESHAKGQKVFELSAYQRRQATFYAAQEAGRQMREGNKDIEPDEFTKAAAQFATTFKEGMLTFANTVSPVVKLFAENTELLLGALAVLFRTPMRNLGNILVNQTQAQNRLDAAKLRADELRVQQQNLGTQSRELWAQNRATLPQLRTRDQITRLEQEAFRAEADAMVKRYDLLEKYEKQLRRKLNSNKTTAAEKVAIQNQLAGLTAQNVAEMARNNANNNKSVREALATSTAATVNAVNAQNRAAETLPLTWRRAGTIIRTELASIGSAVAVVTTGVQRMNNAVSIGIARASVGFTKLLGVLGSWGSAAGIVYMAFEALKAVGDYGGLTSGKVGDLADEFGSASKRINDTVEALAKLNSPKNSNDAIVNAEKIANVYDSISTEVDTLQKKMSGINFGEWKVGAGEVQNFNKVLLQAIPLLDAAAKKRVQNAALANLDTGYGLQQSGVGLVARSLRGKTALDLSTQMAAEKEKVRKILSGDGGLAAVLQQGIVLPIFTSKNALKALAAEMAKSGESSKFFAEALKSAAQAMHDYDESLDTMAKTAVDESPFNSMLDKFKQMRGRITETTNSLKAMMPDVGFVVANKDNKTLAANLQKELDNSFQVMRDFVSKLPGGKSKFVAEIDLQPVVTGDPAKDLVTNYLKELKTKAKISSEFARQEQNIETYRTNWLAANGRQRTANLKADVQKDALARKYDVASLFSAAKEIGDIYNELEKRQEVTKALKVLGPGTDLSGAFNTALSDTALQAAGASESVRVLMGRLKQLRDSYEFTSKHMGLNLRITKDDGDSLYNKLKQAMGLDDVVDPKIKKELDGLARQLAATANNSALYSQAVKDANIDIVTEANLTTALTNAMSAYNIELSTADKYNRQLALAKSFNVKVDAEQEKRVLALIDSVETYHTVMAQAKLATEAFNPAVSLAKIITSDLDEAMIALGDSIATAFQPQVLAEFVLRTRQALRQVAQAKASTVSDIGIAAAKNLDVKDSALTPALAKIRQLYRDIGLAQDAMKDGKGNISDAIAAQQALIDAEEKYRKAQMDEAIRRADAAAGTADWSKELDTLTKMMRKSTLLEAWSGFVDDAVTILASGRDDIARTLQSQVSGRLETAFKEQIKFSQDTAVKGLGKDFVKSVKDGNAGIFSTLYTKSKEFAKNNPKTAEAMQSALPYVGMAIANRDDRNARNVNMSGAAGSLIGAAFGSAAIGGAIGTMIGSAFSKKLKETGIMIQIDAAGKAMGYEAELYKKRSLSSSRKVMQVGSRLEAEFIASIQNTVDQTRRNYQESIDQFSALTSMAFTNTNLNGGVYSKYFMQQAGGSKTTQDLLKDFSMDFGNWLASNQSFLMEFKDVTESLTDTLARLVDSLKVTTSSFQTLFGIATPGLVRPEDMTKVAAISAREISKNIVSVLSEPDAGTEELLFNYATSGDATKVAVLSGWAEKYKALSELHSSITPMAAGFANLVSVAEYYLDGSNAQQLVYKAQLSFLDEAAKSFAGADIKAKQEAYKLALSTYTSAASTSVMAMADYLQFTVLEVDKTASILKGTKMEGTKLKPIMEFNKELKAAVLNGASGEDIGKAIGLGAKLAGVIQGILDSFSQISIAGASSAVSFSKSVIEGISGTFRDSAINAFKKQMLAPLLSDMTAALSTGTFDSSMTDYAGNNSQLLDSARNMVSVLSDPKFKEALNSVGIEFEKLTGILGSTGVLTELTNNFANIAKEMKLAAYSFAVDGNQTSIALFKATEALKAAGVSADIAYMPLGSAVAKLKDLASSGTFSAEGLANVNEALKAMADYSLQARDELVKLKDVSMQVYDATSSSIKSIAYAIIDDADSLDAAKVAITSLMSISGDKVTAAKTAYDKAKQLGNSLDIEEKALTYANAVDASMQLQVEYLDKLSSMNKAKYEAEKSALDTLMSSIQEIKDLAEDIKFDEVLSILKPTARLKASTENFEQLKAKVLADAQLGVFSPDSLAKFQEESRRVLELGREVYASGDAYTELYDSVMSALGKASTDAAAQAAMKEAALKKYQDDSLSYAKQSRDIQYASLGIMSELSRASVVDNAISVDLLNAIKYNSGLPQGLALSDYYNKLFTASQSAASSFTSIGTGYQDFNGIGNYNTQNLQQQEIVAAKVTEVLDKLTIVLANLPVDVKNAIQSTTTLTTKRT